MFLQNSRQHLFLIIFILLLVACGGETPPAADLEAPTTSAPPTSEPTELPPPPTVTTEIESTDAVEEVEAATAVPASPTATALAMEIGQEYNGIYFDPGGLGKIGVNEVAANIGAEGAPYWVTHPPFTEFQFDEYPLTDSFHPPRLIVYPAADFANLNPAAREMITELETVLAEKPTDFSERELPFLPLFNAAQILRAQVDYVPFVNGEGIRFLTYYAQDISPVSNYELFYTFQGLTADGSYYVAAILPIDAPTLPEQAELPADREAFSNSYDEYIQGIVSDLEELTAGEFLPTLTALDQMINSLDVNPTAAPPPTTAEGEVAFAITQPPAQSQLPIGQTAAMSGYLPTGATEPITLTLQVGASTLISTTAQSDIDSGTWSAELPVPLNVTGPGRLIAYTSAETAVQEIVLYAAEADQGPTTITLEQPLANETAVEGRPLFFHGQVTNPISDTLTIGVLINGCTEFIARQSFSLSGGIWNGQVILPADVTGPACVTAYTGSYGAGGWREVMRPFTILDENDETASRVTFGNRFGASYAPGDVVTLYGTAVNPPDGELTVVLKNPDNDVLAETLVTVDSFGYWEAGLTLPADYPANTLILRAAFEEEGETYFAEREASVQ